MKNAEQLEGYRLMVTSRYIDDASAAVLATGQDVPNYHGARGQEAMYAGAVMPLRQDDYLLYNYRAFATLLGKGVSLKELVHDLMLTAQGTTRGHGGIMHVTKPEVGIPGRNGVFGSKFGIALGLAQAAVLKGQQATVLCMFGEAEGNRGALYESLNIAVLRKLPIVYLAENNGFAVASRTETLYSGGNMSNLFRGFDLPVKSIDGNDFETVSTTIAEAVELARQGGGPSYVECLTYRLDPHHGHDDDTLYRDQKEVEQRQEQSDPIVTLRNTLLTNGVRSSELEEIERVAEQHVQEAFAEALAAAAPDISGLLNQVYFKAGAHQ